MRVLVRLILLLTVFTQLQGATLRRVYGHGFSFLIAEPEGWIVDNESAIQIANFVMYPQGMTWRQAEVIVLGRFVEKQKSETLQKFIEGEVDHIEENCPFLEIKDSTLELAGDYKFVVKSQNCPGQRHEVVAFTELPDYFGVFILSAKRKGLIEDALPPYREMLESLQWLGRTRWRVEQLPD